MSDDLLRKLRTLEDDYPGQPFVAQQADLCEINQIRSQLGMSRVDARLQEIGAAPVQAPVKPEPTKVQDHTEAREIYRAYLKRAKELDAHRTYAERVAKATSGPGQTPVRPLAVMGTNGGPLLCDHCNKPIVLEGGNFHGMPADAAWKRNPKDGWLSWILGGMVVEIQTNGTLRIYHGYPGRNNNHCCNIASREDGRARAKFESEPRPDRLNALLAFLEYERPDVTSQERLRLLNEILDTMYSYDPGVGVNRPSS